MYIYIYIYILFIYIYIYIYIYMTSHRYIPSLWGPSTLKKRRSDRRKSDVAQSSSQHCLYLAWALVARYHHTVLRRHRRDKSRRSRRRLDFKYLDLQIGRFPRPLFWMTGNSVHFREKLFEILGIPVKVTGTPVPKLRGLPFKLVENLAVVIIWSPLSSVCGYTQART